MEPIFEIKELNTQDKYTKFEITPLPAGYGDTLGTALRRVLLTNMQGAAVTSVKIDGVRHQFSTLKGMKEDVLDFLLNLKKVRFAYSGNESATVTLSADKVGEVKAGDIKTPTGVKVANPELVLANLSKGAKLSVEMTVSSGVGYSPADEREEEKVGIIPLDASFSPVERVNFKVEDTRVGRLTNYNKLILEVWTDGTISPREALEESAKNLVGYFNQIVSPKVVEKKEEIAVEDTLGPVGRLSVEEIGLPTRVANALAKSGFDTVEKLVNAEKDDLIKVRNLGEKSLDVINDALKEKGVQLANA
ncbi:DNA-directed RNA polymerase subunit alpha [Candidatus Microgenomates bacterium]|nr:MAG: DNA-directed RNA polymerase subunit alpha [Candidatus Microgenomates bacterium]